MIGCQMYGLAFYNQTHSLEAVDRAIAADLEAKRNATKSGSAVLGHFELVDNDFYWNLGFLCVIMLIINCSREWMCLGSSLLASDE